MLLPRFQYQEPKNVTEALHLLRQYKDSAKILAGGTDLNVNMKRGNISPEQVIYIGRIPGLNSVDFISGALRIGPMVTCNQLAGAGLKGAHTALAQAAGGLGTPLIRNRATVAGNLISARPAADMAGPMMVLDGEMILTGISDERAVPLAEYFTGPGRTVQQPNELLTAIQVPAPAPKSGAAYIKLGARKTLEISIVNASAYLVLDESGQVTQAKVALGAVGPTPIFAPSAAKAVIGAKPASADDAIFEAAGEAARGDASPIDDFRGSAEYRQAMIKVLTKRVLSQAWQMAAGE